MLNTDTGKSSINVSFNSFPHDFPQVFLSDPTVQTEPLLFSRFLCQVTFIPKYSLETILLLVSTSQETPGSPLYCQLGPAPCCNPSSGSACTQPLRSPPPRHPGMLHSTRTPFRETELKTDTWCPINVYNKVQGEERIKVKYRRFLFLPILHACDNV